MNPSDAEQQSRQVRVELGETVDALARKLAARQLVEKGCDMITDTLDRYDAVNRSLELIRANPIPLALIGIGAAWLIAANTVPEEQIVAARRKMSDMAGELGNRAGDLASNIGGRIGRGSEQALDQTGNPLLDEANRGRSDGWLHQMTDTTQGALRSTRDAGAAMLDRATVVASDNASRVSEQLSTTFQRNPLIIGAIGIMAGALLAALLPISRAEDRLLRDNQLQKKAGELGEQAMTQMCETAARTLDAAVTAARDEAPRSPHA